MKVALITGVTGQDGSYLAELLLEKGYLVHGVVRPSTLDIMHNISAIRKNHPEQFKLHYGDLLDQDAWIRILSKACPDEVYHLGAQSHVGISFEMPVYTGKATGLSCISLLEAIRLVNPKIKYYQASSSEMFGKVRAIPQTETTPFHPRSPYGCAKVYGYWSVVNYREAYGMHLSNGILFNHESPRRGLQFVTRKITHGLAMILAGKSDKILLGNLDARRDWGYAKEYVEAMWLMLQQESGDDFVVATGKTYSIKDFLQIVFSQVGLNWEDYVKQDKEFFRPSEVDLLVGDPTKAKKLLGWEPKTDLKKLARIMLESDMKRLGLNPNQFGIEKISLKAA